MGSISAEALKSRRDEVSSKIKGLERREAEISAEVSRLCTELGIEPAQLTDAYISQLIASATEELEDVDSKLASLDGELEQWDSAWQSYVGTAGAGAAVVESPPAVGVPAARAYMKGSPAAAPVYDVTAAPIIDDDIF